MRRMRHKQTYKVVLRHAQLDPFDVECRLDKAFDIIFEEIFLRAYESKKRKERNRRSRGARNLRGVRQTSDATWW